MHESSYIKKLTDILVELKAITPKINDALEQNFAASSHERFDDFLLDQGLVDKPDLLKALSMLYEVPYMDVTGYFFDTFLLRKFPMDFLFRNVIIPYEQDQNMLLVVASDPSDPDLLAKIGEHVSYDIRFNVGLSTDIANMIRMYYQKSVTEHRDENQALQSQALDDLPVEQEGRDEQEFMKDKIDQFVEGETEQERQEVEDRADTLEKK